MVQAELATVQTLRTTWQTDLVFIRRLLLLRHRLTRGQHTGSNGFDDEAYLLLVHGSPWVSE